MLKSSHSSLDFSVSVEKGGQACVAGFLYRWLRCLFCVRVAGEAVPAAEVVAAEHLRHRSLRSIPSLHPAPMPARPNSRSPSTAPISIREPPSSGAAPTSLQPGSAQPPSPPRCRPRISPPPAASRFGSVTPEATPPPGPSPSLRLPPPQHGSERSQESQTPIARFGIRRAPNCTSPCLLPTPLRRIPFFPSIRLPGPPARPYPPELIPT